MAKHQAIEQQKQKEHASYVPVDNLHAANSPESVSALEENKTFPYKETAFLTTAEEHWKSRMPAGKHITYMACYRKDPRLGHQRLRRHCSRDKNHQERIHRS